MAFCVPNIEFDKDVFTPGEEVTGKVTINTGKEHTARVVTITFTGRTVTCWKGNKSVKTLTNKKAEETHVMMSHEVWEPENENNVFPSGEYEWNFSFELPKSCPPSFEGRFGFVRYSVLVHIEVPNGHDVKVETCVTVSPPVDLNVVPGAGAPVQAQVEQLTQCFGCLPFKKGNVAFTLSSPSLGYVAGQKIHVTGLIENHTSNTINSLRGGFYRRVIYRDEASKDNKNAKKNTKNEVQQLFQTSRLTTQVSPGQTTEFSFEIDLPAVVPTIRTAYLSVEYFARIIANVSGFTCSEPKADLGLFVGTEPLASAERGSAKQFVKSGLTSQCWSIYLKPAFSPLVPTYGTEKK